jgi:hypothetical protein
MFLYVDLYAQTGVHKQCVSSVIGVDFTVLKTVTPKV